ncbi:unnamed protein product [Ectocarpus sp. CCAP 1310/34]|nr:unnamed protein product [Ectocarpus sp. CCAP 1310/34]
MSGSTTARREVSEWLKSQTTEAGDGGVGRIEIDHVKEEERRIVLKEASRAQVFSITYQKEYPNSVDEYLFLETDSKVADFVAVINDLRDYVYGQPTSLTLTALLDQLKKKSAKKGMGALGAAPSSAALGQEGPHGEVAQEGGEGCSDGGGDGSAGDGGDDEFGEEEEEEEEEEDGNESDYV